jgi:hydroxyacylglutathione hydrolase
MTRLIGAVVLCAALFPPASRVAAAGDQDLHSVPRITIDEVKALIAKKQVIFVDVRDPVAFGAGHIPGAMNVPFDFIPNHVDDWKKDKRLLVTYCACVNEGTAARAALDMNAFGVKNVKALLGGYNEWIKRGEKTEKSGG